MNLIDFAKIVNIIANVDPHASINNIEGRVVINGTKNILRLSTEDVVKLREYGRISFEGTTITIEELVSSRPKLIENPDLTNLIEECEAEINGILEDGRSPKDIEHYIYEVAMKTFYGKDYFKWYNKMSDE